MTEEKKPCPFCGRSSAWVLGPTCTKATPYNASDRAFPVVRCRCGAEVPGDDWDKSGKTAIAAWNRRAPDARDARIAELEAELAALKAPAPIPSNSAELDPATPWYPDDSGEWVEVPEDLMQIPDELEGSEMVDVLMSGERCRKNWGTGHDQAWYWDWSIPLRGHARIVAYKVVKP